MVIPENSTRFYAVGGLAIRIEASLPFNPNTFCPTLELFRVSNPDSDVIQVCHHFSLPELRIFEDLCPVYRKAPWEIYHHDLNWIYLGIPAEGVNTYRHMAGVFNDDHSHGDIYHPNDFSFQRGNLTTLTLIPTDQILLARVFAFHQACLLHACGMIIQGHGMAFVGHSEAGKTTTARILQGEGELLCDDRIVLRRWPEGFRIYGTWSHGDIPDVSANSAPLRAVFLLEQAPENRIIRLKPSQVVQKLPEFVVKGLVTRDWWENILETIGALAREVPVYRLRLDKSGAIIPLLRSLLSQPD